MLNLTIKEGGKVDLYKDGQHIGWIEVDKVHKQHPGVSGSASLRLHLPENIRIMRPEVVAKYGQNVLKQNLPTPHDQQDDASLYRLGLGRKSSKE